MKVQEKKSRKTRKGNKKLRAALVGKQHIQQQELGKNAQLLPLDIPY
jgi:hypothetical protein